MATVKTVVVDTDATQSPHYTSLAAAIAGESGGSPAVVTSANLVANDEQVTFDCRATTGVADTAAVNFAAGIFTVDSTRYARLIGDNRSGLWNTSAYRLEIAGVAIIEAIDYIRLENLQIWCNQDANNVQGVRLTAAPNGYLIYNCIIRGTTYSRQQAGVQCGASQGWIINNLIYGWDGGSSMKGLELDGPYGSHMTAYNNTIVGCYLGINIQYTREDRMLLKNNFIGDCTTVSNIIAANLFAGSTTNGSDDGVSLGTDYVDLSGYDTTADLYADYDNGDFSVKASSPLIDTGADLHADSDFPFNVDITATTERPNGAWDIGAFEYVAAGGGGIDESMDVTLSALLSGTGSLLSALDPEVESGQALTSRITSLLDVGAEPGPLFSGAALRSPLDATAAPSITLSSSITGGISITVNASAAMTGKLASALSATAQPAPDVIGSVASAISVTAETGLAGRDILGGTISISAEPGVEFSYRSTSTGTIDITAAISVEMTGLIRSGAAITAVATPDATGRIASSAEVSVSAVIAAASRIISALSPEAIAEAVATGAIMSNMDLTAEALAELVYLSELVLTEILELRSPVTTQINISSPITATLELESPI